MTHLGFRFSATGISLVAVASALGAAHAAPAKVSAIGIENEYADVISQIGGEYVSVKAIITDPNTDPHTFEANPKIAATIGSAELIVENGEGYETWADKMIAATPNPKRDVIVAQKLLGMLVNAPNPHLWYDPKTMPAVAEAVADGLSKMIPSKSAYFKANVKKFDESLKPWLAAIAAFKKEYGGTEVAVTEPVADYMLEAAGCKIPTPYSLQAAIMNGTDPSPQDVTTENNLFSDHKVKVFAYNQQVTDALTHSFLSKAKKSDVPVIGVYETMPTPGYTYQSWMMAEVEALKKAIKDKVSTETLLAGK